MLFTKRFCNYDLSWDKWISVYEFNSTVGVVREYTKTGNIKFSHSIGVFRVDENITYSTNRLFTTSYLWVADFLLRSFVKRTVDCTCCLFHLARSDRAFCSAVALLSASLHIITYHDFELTLKVVIIGGSLDKCTCTFICELYICIEDGEQERRRTWRRGSGRSEFESSAFVPDTPRWTHSKFSESSRIWLPFQVTRYESR